MLLEFLLMGVHHIVGQRVVVLRSSEVRSQRGIRVLNSHPASLMPDVRGLGLLATLDLGVVELSRSS